MYKMVPKVKLNDGTEMPVIGLGTYKSEINEAEIAVKCAIEVGYRHIDTAYIYGNEEQVGRGIKAKIEDGTVKRKDLYVVTKIWSTFMEPKRVEGVFRASLKNLGLDYIDLYLMHNPVALKYVDDKTSLPLNEKGELLISDVDYLDTWRAMEKLMKTGLVRSLGVSNFNSEQMKRLMENCEIKPVTNQVECHPALNQKKLNDFCKKYDVLITAYCPLGRPNPIEKTPNYIYDEKVKKISEKYGKTPAQVVLRYLIDIGTVPIPKSSNPKRIKENIEVFDFELTNEDKKVMDSYNSGERLVVFEVAKHHKNYPFSLPY